MSAPLLDPSSGRLLCRSIRHDPDDGEIRKTKFRGGYDWPEVADANQGDQLDELRPGEGQTTA